MREEHSICFVVFQISPMADYRDLHSIHVFSDGVFYISQANLSPHLNTLIPHSSMEIYCIFSTRRNSRDRNSRERERERERERGRQMAIPDGWTLTHVPQRDGSTSRCFTNVLGQKFSSFKALMHYVRRAKREKLSIYSPGFVASTLGKRKSVLPKSSKIKKPFVTAKNEEKVDEAAGKESLGSSAHASDQSEKYVDPEVKPLSTEGAKNKVCARKRLASAPAANVLPRRSARLARLPPGNAPVFSANQYPPAVFEHATRRASSRLAGLKSEFVPSLI